MKPNEHSSKSGKFAWAMYDFANSGYATVVLTTIFNTWFVTTIAGNDGHDQGTATLLWTITIAIGNAFILLSAPVIGAMADLYGIRKKLLVASSLGCILFTAMLAIPGPGDTYLAMWLVILSYFMFATGENLVAAFLPELAPASQVGRLSGYGWALGFAGGLLTLAICLIYVSRAEHSGQTASEYIPVTMIVVAIIFFLAALPAFFVLHENRPQSSKSKHQFIRRSFIEVISTVRNLGSFPDLSRFMVALTCFHGGIYIVIILAAVYAEQVMGFSTKDNIKLIAIVNITAAVGAFGFGHLQDRLGSVFTLKVTLVIWCIAIILAWAAHDLATFWIAANLIGLSLGATQSASRALVGLLSPPGRYGEFFGLWGLSVKLAAIIGPVSYGIINHVTGGDHRSSLLVTLVFFIAGLLMLFGINEKRGIDRAHSGT